MDTSKEKMTKSIGYEITVGLSTTLNKPLIYPKKALKEQLMI
jgi:hypothetical protein